MNLRIGPGLSLPSDALTETFGIVAKRGAGKTYTALVMAEEMLKASLPVIIVDPVGVCWGLRSSADGRSPGLPILILGGEHADLPLEPAAGEVIADFIVEHRQSIILDMSLWRKKDQKRFVLDFAERLYQRNRQPLHILLDEADMFAPQRPIKGEERMLGAVEDLVRRGRARGIGLTLITQRTAVLNKDVLTQCEVLVALRTVAPQDIDAVDAWVKRHARPGQREKFLASLPSLPQGTAWFWSPGWLDVFKKIEVRTRDTFDSSATPKVGEKPRRPKAIAPVDLEALKGRIAATVERAKAEDPSLLRTRIAELERQARSKPSPPPAPPPAPTLSPQMIEEINAAHGEITATVNAINEEAKSLAARSDALYRDAQVLHSAANNLRSAVEKARSPTPPAETKNWLARVPASSTLHRAAKRGGVELPRLRAGERRMLEAIRRSGMNLTRAGVGTLAGMAMKGGTFGSYLSHLKGEGLVEETNGFILLTSSGGQAAGVGPALTRSEVIGLWNATLRLGERRMLEALIERYPHWIERNALGEMAGVKETGGTFGSYLSNLRRNGLVEVSHSGVRVGEIIMQLG